MITSTNKLSPAVQAIIAASLLAMFAGVLFLPGFRENFKIDADSKQTLFTLVTAVVFFFIGKNTDSANREAAITAAAIAPVAVAATALGAGPTGKPGDPVSVDIENPEGKK